MQLSTDQNNLSSSAHIMKVMDIIDHGPGIPMLPPPLGNFVPLYFWNPWGTPYSTRGVSKGETWKNDVIGGVYDVITPKISDFRFSSLTGVVIIFFPRFPLSIASH